MRPIPRHRPTSPFWVILILCFFNGIICAAEITTVSVTQDTVSVRGNADPGKDFELQELLPHLLDTTTEPTRRFPIAADEAGTFQIELPRHAPDDRILSRWRIGNGDAKWPTDVSRAAAHPNLKSVVAKNRKGLGGIHPDPRLFGDLVELGVGHITVNIHLTPELPQGQVRQLDKLLTFAHENGIVVTAILLIPPRGSALVHPDCDPKAHFSLPNVTDKAGTDAFATIVGFLAERYCQPASPHGRISHWIVGNEVDAGWVWTNGGEQTAEQYMEQYHRALRIAYYTVRRFDPHGKVFITLTHHWNSAHQPEPLRFYQPRHLLGLLQTHGARGGDFEWGVAYHPYSDDLFNPKTWEDKKITDTFDTPLITMKNIGVLEKFLTQPEFLYRGKQVRTVLLSEQGYHTADKDPQAQELQAAAIVYAWRQLQSINCIEAFHYHRWIDHEREGGLNLGLWTVKKGTQTWPKEKKRSWSVFRSLGTPDEARETAFADEIIGKQPSPRIESTPELK